MMCPLGKALGCEGLKEDDHCGVFFKEGVKLRVFNGVCEFKNIRAPRKGIYELKSDKKLNPLKASKATKA